MSNYIYNNNPNDNNGDKEPIQFNFGNTNAKSKQSTVLTIVFGVLSAILSVYIILSLLGIIGTETETRVENTVYTNSIYKSPEASSVYTGDETSRAEVIALIKDSVVEIRTQYVVAQQQFIQSGAGSGVIVGNYETDKDEKGYYIITNAHVIENTASTKSKITVTLTDGTQYNADVVGSDTLSDIAVLKIKETKALKCATFANESYNLRVGDDVIAIGNPLGELGGTVTNGYISALDREIEIDGIKMNLLQTDAPINPGNSGGGLFNLRGELVGIVNAKSTGTDIEGLGFAIPSNDALKVYEDLINYGYVKGRPTIYVKYDMQYSGGVYVTEIMERASGDNSNKLQLHDQIYGAVVDGKNVAITSKAQLDSIINDSEIGSEITLIVKRGFQQGKVTVKVFEYVD